MNILIAIAINDYKDAQINNLNNSVSDINKLIELFKARYQFDDYIELTEPNDTTGELIFSTLDNEFKNALPEDNIVLIFAGHGGYDDISKSAYWQPSDAKYANRQSWFALTELISMIRASQAHHIGLIIDSCYAGVIFEEVSRGELQHPDKNIKSRYALTSGGIEKVKDGKFGDQSPFNKVLMDVLRENIKPEFSLSELSFKLRENFGENHIQTPRSGPIYQTGDEGGSFIFKLKELNFQKSNWTYPKYNPDDSIIDQLFGLIEFIFNEINFIPNHILAQYYPFRKNEKTPGYVDRSNIHTSNPAVIELFQSVSIVNSDHVEFKDDKFTLNTIDATYKILTIIKTLNLNLITSIDSESLDERIDIKINVNENPSSLLYKTENTDYLSLKITDLLPSKSNPSTERAFVNYQLGNISWAIEELIFFKETTPNDSLKNFIINFNLTRLRSLLWRFYYGRNNRPDLITKLDKINLTKEFSKSVDKPNQLIFEWIYREYFLSKGYKTVFDIRDKILRHSENVKSGGTGINDFTWELIYNYANFYHFIRSNYLIFEKFKEFLDITDAFIDGLLASHSVLGDNSKLEYFDDYLLDVILHHGRSKKIVEHLTKHNLQSIRVKNCNNTVKKICSIIGNYSKNIEHSRIEFEGKSNIFSDHIQKLLHNGLTIAAISNFDELQIKKIAKQLNEYLISAFSRFDTDSLRLFLSLKCKEIGNNLMNTIILNSLLSKRIESSILYQELAHTYKKNSFELKWSEKDFSLFLELIDDDLEFNPFVIVELWRILKSEKQKKQLENCLDKYFEHDFHPKLMEHCLIYGVLKFEQKHIDNFVDTISKEKLLVKKQLMYPKENILLSLDSFINICFKFDFDLQKKQFKDLIGITDYYDWLLDINLFDYSKFKIEWLRSSSFTSNYYKKFNQSKELKSCIEDFLRNNSDKLVESIYMNSYIYCVWD